MHLGTDSIHVMWLWNHGIFKWNQNSQTILSRMKIALDLSASDQMNYAVGICIVNGLIELIPAAFPLMNGHFVLCTIWAVVKHNPSKKRKFTSISVQRTVVLRCCKLFLNIKRPFMLSWNQRSLSQRRLQSLNRKYILSGS